MRLYYLPEFWVLLIAFIYAGTGLIMAVRNSMRVSKEMDDIIKKHSPNVSEPIISKRYLLTCKSCFYINEFRVNNKGVVTGAKELNNGN